MKVALIGASGFVGTRLIDILKGYEDYSLKNIDIVPSHFFNDISIIGDATALASPQFRFRYMGTF